MDAKSWHLAKQFQPVRGDIWTSIHLPMSICLGCRKSYFEVQRGSVKTHWAEICNNKWRRKTTHYKTNEKMRSQNLRQLKVDCAHARRNGFGSFVATCPGTMARLLKLARGRYVCTFWEVVPRFKIWETEDCSIPCDNDNDRAPFADPPNHAYLAPSGDVATLATNTSICQFVEPACQNPAKSYISFHGHLPCWCGDIATGGKRALQIMPPLLPPTPI